MKLIKLIIVGLVTLTMVFAQENQQGEDGDHDGGPSFEDVDTNGDGVIDREEARAAFGDEPEFDAEYDRISGDDGVIDHAEFMAEDDGDHEGEFYCGECDASFVSEGEMNEHMQREHGEGYSGPPTNHWDGNCAAICGGHSEYWLETDGNPDNGAEDGPYATWDHDNDGNPVDCGCGDDGNHEDDGDHGGYDNLGGDTSWADAAYQIDGNQEHYDIVMSVPEEDREKVYEDIKRDVEEHRGDHDGDGSGGPPPIPNFGDIDVDENGFASMDEARAYFSNRPDWEEDTFEEDFNRVDQNDDGQVDYDEHMSEVGQVIAGSVLRVSLQNGASPDEAFNNIAGALYEYFVVETEYTSEDEFANARDAAHSTWNQAMQNGPPQTEEEWGAALGAAMEAGNQANNPNNN